MFLIYHKNLVNFFECNVRNFLHKVSGNDANDKIRSKIIKLLWLLILIALWDRTHFAVLCTISLWVAVPSC